MTEQFANDIQVNFIIGVTGNMCRCKRTMYRRRCEGQKNSEEYLIGTLLNNSIGISLFIISMFIYCVMLIGA